MYKSVFLELFEAAPDLVKYQTEPLRSRFGVNYNETIANHEKSKAVDISLKKPVEATQKSQITSKLVVAVYKPMATDLSAL